MTSQEMVSETDDLPNDRLTSPVLSYPQDESHWSQNHGPTIFALTAFTLIVGYGVIFFNSTTIDDNSKPLVPNNFVPDEDSNPTNEPSPSAPLSQENTNKSSDQEAKVEPPNTNGKPKALNPQ